MLHCVILQERVAQEPLHALLCSATRDEVRTYASLLRWRCAEDVARYSVEVVRRGRRAVKLFEIDPGCIHAARAATPADTRPILNINCVWGEEVDAVGFYEAVKTWVSLGWRSPPGHPKIMRP